MPPNTFSLISPPDSGSVGFPTPNFLWSATTDIGSGLSHYQLWIDDSLSADNIEGTTSAPGLPLTMGYHTWFVKAIDEAGNERKSSQVWAVGVLVTDVETTDEEAIPTEFALSQNYPNPFNPETTIEYQIPKRAQVSLRIYNLMGQEIVTLVNEEKAPGYYKVIWEGKDAFGQQVASGIYVYQLRAGDFVASKKLILLR